MQNDSLSNNNQEVILADTSSQLVKAEQSGQLIYSEQQATKPAERVEVSPIWEISVVLVALIILAILKRVFSKKLVQYANALVSNRFIGQLTREERSSESLSVILFELLYFLVMALFTNAFYSYINPEFLLSGFEGFALFLLVFLVFHLFKVFINNVIGWLLEQQLVLNDFQFFNFLGHGAMAIGLIPIVILQLFSHLDTGVLLIIGGLVIGLMYLYRLARLTTRFWMEKSFRLKYFILYICGLEILPVLVLVKFASKTL